MRESAITVTRGFVDSIEEDIASMVIGERTARIPASLLPDGVGAGSWVEIRVKALPAPDGGSQKARRKRLVGDDGGGGDLKL